MGIENSSSIVGRKVRKDVDPQQDFNKIEAFTEGSPRKFKKSPAWYIQRMIELKDQTQPDFRAAFKNTFSIEFLNFVSSLLKPKPE